jgi:hypothetical protein
VEIIKGEPVDFGPLHALHQPQCRHDLLHHSW